MCQVLTLLLHFLIKFIKIACLEHSLFEILIYCDLKYVRGLSFLSGESGYPRYGYYMNVPV